MSTSGFQHQIVELKAGGPDDPNGSRTTIVLDAYFQAEQVKVFRRLLWPRPRSRCSRLGDCDVRRVITRTSTRVVARLAVNMPAASSRLPAVPMNQSIHAAQSMCQRVAAPASSS
jgi:hypothetical protein